MKIKAIKWGKIEVGEKVYKDAMIYPEGSKAWDWNISGTSHSPGIQTADIKFLIDKGAKVIVLSAGYFKRLKLSEDAKNYLIKHSIEYYYRKTGEAADLFNQLANEKAVGGLFHTTC